MRGLTFPEQDAAEYLIRKMSTNPSPWTIEQIHRYIFFCMPTIRRTRLLVTRLCVMDYLTCPGVIKGQGVAGAKEVNFIDNPIEVTEAGRNWAWEHAREKRA